MKRFKGVLVFLLQWAALMAIDCLLSPLIWLVGPWYEIAKWGAMPLMGMVAAYLTTIHGVNNYLAWIAPPACAFVSHWLTLGFAPDGPGPTLLCGFLAIVGAAAGDVVKAHRR